MHNAQLKHSKSVDKFDCESQKMKVFAAVTLVVVLCCLEVALSYPLPVARTQERIAGHQRMAGPQDYEAAYISTELCMQLYAVHFSLCYKVYYV